MPGRSPIFWVFEHEAEDDEHIDDGDGYWIQTSVARVAAAHLVSRSSRQFGDT